MLFSATLGQMAFLFSFILLGFCLAKFNCIPADSETVLSRLENYLFIPALVLSTFMNYFTAQKLSSSWKLLAGSLLLELIVLPIALLCVRLCAKDGYTRNIYLYGLCFSNFGFMGNAIVSALFRDIFLEYMIFTLVLWIFIYLWGVPSLLMGETGARRSLRDKLKSFVNPMFGCMVLGMLIGILQLPVPGFLDSVVTCAGNCMSPVAMLLTGMTIAKTDLRSVLRIKSIYVISALRLLVFPFLLIAALLLAKDVFSKTFVICAVCSLAMPLGLNTIVIPSAYGKDTRVASGMTLVSHVLSCATIPAVFLALGYLL